MQFFFIFMLPQGIYIINVDFIRLIWYIYAAVLDDTFRYTLLNFSFIFVYRYPQF